MRKPHIKYIQVDEVKVFLKTQGTGAHPIQYFRLDRRGGNTLPLLNFSFIRKSVVEALGVGDNPEIDLLLFCLPHVECASDQLPLLLPQGKEMQMMVEISTCVYEDTHTLHLEAMPVSTPRLGPLRLDYLTSPPAGLWVGGYQHTRACGDEPENKPGDDAAHARIIQNFGHDHVCSTSQQRFESNRDYCQHQLLNAAGHGCIGCVRYLLDHRAVDVNYKSASGATAMDVACSRNHFHVVWLMLAHGGRCEKSVQLEIW